MLNLLWLLGIPTTIFAWVAINFGIVMPWAANRGGILRWAAAWSFYLPSSFVALGTIILSLLFATGGKL